MEQPEQAKPAEVSAGTGLAWTKLLKWSAIASVIAVALINVFAGIIPPLIVFGLIWIGGVIWLRKSTKGPAILLLVSFLAFFALSAPFVIPSLTAPASSGDFILNLASVVAGILGLVAAIAVLRGRIEGSGAARSLAMVGIALFVLGTIGSVIANITYEDAVAQAGDIELVTRNLVFADESLEADAGEIAVLVDNEDQTFHTFTIDELDVNLNIPASKAARITFDAEPGEYLFYCVPHEGAMEGTLVVR